MSISSLRGSESTGAASAVSVAKTQVRLPRTLGETRTAFELLSRGAAQDAKHAGRWDAGLRVLQSVTETPPDARSSLLNQEEGGDERLVCSAVRQAVEILVGLSSGFILQHEDGAGIHPHARTVSFASSLS